MSDLKDEDLLAYELDDIDDQALYGADEDELLLTDEELEKDVTNEEKQQIKAEAEKWVREKMLEQKKPLTNNKVSSASDDKKSNENIETSQKTMTATNVVYNTQNTEPPTEVSSTANNAPVELQPAVAVFEDVSTSEMSVQKAFNDASVLKQPPEIKRPSQSLGLQAANGALTSSSNAVSSHAEETISSSSKDIDADIASVISCSTTGNVTDSSVLASSQESLIASNIGGDYGDPREDCDEEREERTNIKTTNERDVESSNSEQSPDKHQRYPQNKRAPGDVTNTLIRPHRYSSRPPYHSGPPRPMMNRGAYPPMAHGNFALFAAPNAANSNVGVGGVVTATAASNAGTSTLIHAISSPSLLPGHFPPQHPASNTPPHNMYVPSTAPHTTQQQTLGGLPSSPPNPLNTVVPPHQHEIMQRMPLRHPYPGFRQNAPMGGNFRHPIHGNIYNPHDFNGNGPPHGPPPYGQNFLPHVRGIFRPEIPQGIPPRLPPLPNLRMQRAPLPPHNIIGSAGYPSAPPGNAVRQPLPAQQQSAQAGGTGTANVPNPPSNISIGLPTSGGSSATVAQTALRPSKVLINPNFKGGVEAATSKFIQETQFMAAIGGVSRSDAELLRQQEEFINKNRQHIEKRRNERATSPSNARRSSRSRSRSRDRSYTPPNKRTGGVGSNDRHFDRERDRDRERGGGGGSGSGGGGLIRGSSRERDRERERERDRDRDRDRSGAHYGGRSGLGGNRFRRGNSRDRGGNLGGDYEGRGGGGPNNYNKRRRSISPAGNRGGGLPSGRRGRSGDRERNEDEDDETRAYRLKIEKQKELREKIMRDKEMKRRRAAEEKQHEEKRAPPGNANNNSANNNNSNKTSNNSNNLNDEPQKLKPIIVTQPKMISLKKRQAPNESNIDRHQQQISSPSRGPQPRRQLPTAKILPEAKRTLTEHLTGSSSGGGGGIGSGSHSSNTAIIKPVQKSRDTLKTLTPPLPGTITAATSSSSSSSTSLPSKHTRRLSTPSDDEVQLDYDDDELMLDEEDRLLATPSPSPTRRTGGGGISRTPSPEPPSLHSNKNKTQKNIASSSNAGPFSSTNRRVVLKGNSNTERLTTTDSSGGRGRNRQRETGGGGNGGGSGGGGGNSNSSHSSRKGIFDRLDIRSGGGGNNSSGVDAKRKAHRIVLKHN